MSEAPISCFACEREPTQQCARCGRPYCDEHGEELCDACLEPASGVPSFTLYRGSLLALLIGTALAIWLLVQPGGSSGENALVPIEVTSTPTTVAQGGSTPSPGTTTTPSSDETPGAGDATPSTTPGSGESLSYTVEAGDTLSAICTAVGPEGLSNSDCVEQVMELNGITDPNSISPGQELLIPQ